MIHFSDIDSQSRIKEDATKRRKTQYITAAIKLAELILKYTGIRNRNSASYKIKSSAIIKNPKFIDTRKAWVLLKPHSYTFSLAL